jgi:hypothetical protein
MTFSWRAIASLASGEGGDDRLEDAAERQELLVTGRRR